MAARSRQAYPHQVRCYIAWLRASSPVDGDPLADAGTPDWAVRDYKRHLNAVERSRQASVNPALIKSVYTLAPILTGAQSPVFLRRLAASGRVTAEQPPAGGSIRQPSHARRESSCRQRRHAALHMANCRSAISGNEQAPLATPRGDRFETNGAAPPTSAESCVESRKRVSARADRGTRLSPQNQSDSATSITPSRDPLPRNTGHVID